MTVTVLAVTVLAVNISAMTVLAVNILSMTVLAVSVNAVTILAVTVMAECLGVKRAAGHRLLTGLFHCFSHTTGQSWGLETLPQVGKQGGG